MVDFMLHIFVYSMPQHTGVFHAEHNPCVPAQHTAAIHALYTAVVHASLAAWLSWHVTTTSETLINSLQAISLQPRGDTGATLMRRSLLSNDLCRVHMHAADAWLLLSAVFVGCILGMLHVMWHVVLFNFECIKSQTLIS
jgi:hypothetical protein